MEEIFLLEHFCVQGVVVLKVLYNDRQTDSSSAFTTTMLLLLLSVFVLRRLEGDFIVEK